MPKFKNLVCAMLLVTASLPAQSPTPVQKLEKITTIGDGASDVILSSVSAAVFDSNRRLIVADYKEGLAFVFDQRGQEVGRFGRKGAGPGEYRAIDQLGWMGDTLWVYDGSLRRMTYLHANKLLRSESSFPTLPAGLSYATPLSLFNGIEFGVGSYSRGETRESLPGFLLYRRRMNSTSIDTVAWLSRRNSALVLNVSSGGRLNQLRGVQPLDDAPIAAARSSGGFIIVERPATQVSNVSRLKVRAFSAAGTLSFERELSTPAVEVTPAIRAEMRSRLCVSRVMPNAQRMCTDDEADKALWFPPVLAPASAATGCSDGSVWIRLADSPLAKFQEYHGFRSDGSAVGRLRLPATAHIMDCRGELFAVALRPTSSFEPVVTLYRLARP